VHARVSGEPVLTALIIGVSSTATIVLGNNERENAQFREACRRCEAIIGRSLSDEEKQRLHRAISGQGYDLQEIVDICVDMFADASPPWDRFAPPRISLHLWSILRPTSPVLVL
jgi:hypothetical protein